MSKAVTNEEVEDVLSSIRRLVSEDKRPLAGLSSAPREVAPAPVAQAEPVADRLVLTPALRVADAPEPDSAPLDLGSVARETWAPSDEAAEALDDGAPMMLHPSDADDDIDALVQGTMNARQNDDTGLTDGDYSDEEYWDEDEVEAELSTSPAPMEDVESDETDVESDFGDDGDWDDEIAAYDDQWDVEPASGGLVLEDEDAYFEPDPVIEPDAGSEVEPTVQDANILKADVPLMAKIAALGAAIGKSPQEWEPDGDEANDMAATPAPAMAWEDDVEFDAKGSPLPEKAIEDIATAAKEELAEEAGKATLAAAFSGEDQLMDEDALRDLVSEIVRSELQGALGERITRNVRKLVRREIHRALTAQEIE